MLTTTRPNGAQAHFNAKTQMTVITDAGGRVAGIENPGLRASGFRADGRASLIERSRNDGSRLIVRRGGYDLRHTEVVRLDGVRIVSSGGRGFVERPFRPGYVVRTYVRDGRSEARVYRTGAYGDMRFNHYVPAVAYRPAFYRWAANPWRQPVTYVWAPTPMQQFYTGYVTPEPEYPSASLWITDFLLQSNLQTAYESQVAANDGIPPPPPPPEAIVPMPPQVKAMLAEEVRRQIEVEQSMATPGQPDRVIADSAPPSALDPALSLFVVHMDMEVMPDGNSASCALSPGDVMQRISNDIDDDGKVAVMILSAKNPDCPPSFQTAVDLATLQDMHNQFREYIVAGLGRLAENSGKDGIPTAPVTEARSVPEAQAQADVNARELLADQLKEADLAENEAMLASESSI